MPHEEDDTVVASYDVYVQSPARHTDAEESKYYVLQYPSHRPSNKPYTSSKSQKPTSFRIKPNAGIFEIDVPLLTADNYNAQLGAQLGKALGESTNVGHGLSGGFAHSTATTVNLADIPEHGFEDHSLQTQTLGGKSSKSTEKEPVYMLATLSSKQIHLRHLDGVIQMRPQLHHIDAIDEAKKRAEVASKVKAAPVPETAEGAAKRETRAIEMKLKDSNKDDPKDRNLNANAKLLRDIQNDVWQKYEWIERSEAEFDIDGDSNSIPQTKLAAAIDNDAWLDRMSSPGIELRARLKGRDRERARRKRQERARNIRAAERQGVIEHDDSDSMSSDSDAADIGPVNVAGLAPAPPLSPEVKIKQESGASDPSSTTAVKRRGRPPKNAVK